MDQWDLNQNNLTQSIDSLKTNLDQLPKHLWKGNGTSTLINHDQLEAIVTPMKSVFS